MASTPVKSLQEQKRDLIAQCQLHREALVGDCAQVSASLSWVPRTVSVIRSISPLLIVAAPLVGWFARKKLRNGKAKVPEDRATDKKKKAGLLALAFQGFRMYKQAAPFIQGFMKAWPSTKSERDQRDQPHRAADARRAR